MDQLKKIARNTFVTISFVGDSEMKKLNKKYRNKDYPTDVLSFDIDEKTDDDKFYLGDIAVNIEQAERQAGKFGNTLQEEVSALVAHGMLHLQGVHHKGDD